MGVASVIGPIGAANANDRRGIEFFCGGTVDVKPKREGCDVHCAAVRHGCTEVRQIPQNATMGRWGVVPRETNWHRDASCVIQGVQHAFYLHDRMRFVSVAHGSGRRGGAIVLGGCFGADAIGSIRRFAAVILGRPPLVLLILIAAAFLLIFLLLIVLFHPAICAHLSHASFAATFLLKLQQSLLLAASQVVKVGEVPSLG